MNQPRRILPHHATRHRLLLLVILLAAFALRVYRLDAQSLWYDEGVTADVAQRSLGELTRWTANDIQPPLYYYVVAAWGQLAGWREWSLRFPSAFFGVLLPPLLAGLAYHLLRRPNVRWLAAFFAACHPLLVYYSQEARMYALLTTLGVLLVYCVVRISEAGNARPFYRYYLLAAVAAIYTHYFAFFLLFALLLAFLFEQWRQTVHETAFSRRLFSACPRHFLLTNLLVLVLYLPWCTAMFTRFSIDASYWQGQLKLWEALRSVAISFTTGQTVRETQAVHWLWVYGLITSLAMLLLLRSAWLDNKVIHKSVLTSPSQEILRFRTPHSALRTLQYALPWLIIPVAAVLLLASFAPKFNARYVMIALPSLLLLWTAGLSVGLETRDQRLETRDQRPETGDRRPETNLCPLSSVLCLLSSVLCILFLLFTALYADRNWFFDPAFTKDEWRDVVTFLRTRMRPDETVLLVSGHVWPVWHYYAPDIPAVRLPPIDVLDVNAVLTFANTAAPLRAAFAKETGKTGAWLVEWQDEVVDPTGIVPVQLELAGREKGQPTPFWKLKLRRFANIKPKHIADAPPITIPVSANFDNQLLLHGYTVLDNGDLLLFWERTAASQTQTADIQITGKVSTPTGTAVHQLADQRPAGYDYPVARWPVGQSVMGRIPAKQWLGDQVADGTYKLRLSVYTVTSGELHKLTLPTGQDFIELAPVTVRLD
ncbi:MAG: glycosyltransferase family 39 protein [Caldilineaceae bacterium]